MAISNNIKHRFAYFTMAILCLSALRCSSSDQITIKERNEKELSGKSKIAGYIYDAQTGECLEKAYVICNSNEQKNAGSETDSLGHFNINALIPGLFELKCGGMGYTSKSIIKLKLNANEEIILEIKLKPIQIPMPEGNPISL